MPFWGQKGVFWTKEGMEAVGGAAVPSRPVQRQNKPKACPYPYPHPCPCPVSVPMSTPVLLLRLCGQPVWQRAMPRGWPPSPLGHHRTVPGSAQPERSPWPLLDAGIRAMAFQLEEWWQSQRVLRCHLLLSLCAPGVPMVAQTWLWSLGTSHPRRTGRSWASASRGGQHRPTDSTYTRMQRGPWGEGDACQESPAPRAGSGWGEAVCMQGPGGGCNLSPYPFGHPGTCRTMRLKQASMRGWQAEKNIVFTRRKHWAPQGQGQGLRGTRNTVRLSDLWGVREPIQPLPPSMGAQNKHPPLSHPQEHPSVPRSILGVWALRPLGTSVGE